MNKNSSMGRKILLATVLVTLLVVPAARGEDETDAVLAGMEEFWSGVTTFSADFRQEKTLAFFPDTIYSTGTLLFEKPGRMLWRYDTPDDTVMSVSPGRVMFYFPGLNQARIMYPSSEDDAAGPASMGFGMGGGMGEMTDRFSVTVERDGNEVEVTFIPKETNDDNRVEKVIIRVDEDSMPIATAFHETTGGVTELLFSNPVSYTHLRAHET